MRNKKQMNKLALQTKLKRLLIAGGLAALVAVPLLSGNAGMRKVDAAQGDVKINSTNFPDEGFRKYISKNIDRNKDGVLSKAEIKKVTEIKLEHYEECGNEIGIKWLKSNINKSINIDDSNINKRKGSLFIETNTDYIDKIISFI